MNSRVFLAHLLATKDTPTSSTNRGRQQVVCSGSGPLRSTQLTPTYPGPVTPVRRRCHIISSLQTREQGRGHVTCCATFGIYHLSPPNSPFLPALLKRTWPFKWMPLPAGTVPSSVGRELERCCRRGGVSLPGPGVVCSAPSGQLLPAAPPSGGTVAEGLQKPVPCVTSSAGFRQVPEGAFSTYSIGMAP